MAWTTPLTAVANATLTAAQWNASVRDNLNETAVAKATTAGSLFVASGSNALVERTPEQDEEFASESTTSTSYTDLSTVGPSVTVTTGSKALVLWTASLIHNTVGARALMSFAMSGSSSIAADDNHSLTVKSQDTASSVDLRATGFRMINTLTAGSNTFTAKYRTTSGTATFDDRYLFVMPL